MKRGAPLLALVATVLLHVTAAHATDGIGISDDGVTFSAGLDRPLFDPAVRWVPGDSRTKSFFVRNQGPSGASMTIEARSADKDELLADDDIDLRARADGGGWVVLRNGIASTRLTDEAIEQGGVVRVDVNAVFDPASTNQSQVKRLALDFRVQLADARGTAGEPGDDHDGGTDVGDPSTPQGASGLPDTGATAPQWLVAVGAALALSGITLLARRREDERTTS